jgi:hypothetical protein
MAGCAQTPEQQLVGAWSTDRNASKIPHIANREFDRKIRRGLEGAQLKLSADHSYVLVGPAQVSGKWSYSEGQLTLTPNDEDHLGPVSKFIKDFHVSKDFGSMAATIETPLGKFIVVLNKTA